MPKLQIVKLGYTKEGEVMEKLSFYWKGKTATFETGERLYVNRICVASYNWDGVTPIEERKERGNWAGHIDLPSLKNREGLYANDTIQLKARIEKIITQWFNEALAKAEGKLDK